MEAAKAGNKSKARQLLARAIQLDPQNEMAWLWLSEVAKDDKERIRILAQVLKINPENQLALHGMKKLGVSLEAETRPSAPSPLKKAIAGDKGRAAGGSPPARPRTPSSKPPAKKKTPSKREKLRLKDVIATIAGLGRRILLISLLLLALIFLVNLCAELAFRGGLSSFGEAFPESLTSSYQFLKDLFQGNVEALEEMWRVLPRSLGLLAVSLALGIAIGLPMGTLAAARRHGRVSGLVISASVLGVSTPSYVAAMFLIWSVVAIFRSTGVRLMPTFGFGWDRHLLMPALVLATRPMANMTRLSYSALIDIFSADYVRTAHSKGLVPRLVFWRHVLRNAGVPLLTTAGVAFRFSLAMLPIVEYIFSWPGIGLALLEAIGSGDVYRILVMVLPLALLFTLVNLLLDFIYGFIDPRLRSGEGAAR
jgi:ABC-type dipeptide/oligopeptide/nickel transport system permease component